MSLILHGTVGSGVDISCQESQPQPQPHFQAQARVEVKAIAVAVPYPGGSGYPVKMCDPSSTEPPPPLLSTQPSTSSTATLPPPPLFNPVATASLLLVCCCIIILMMTISLKMAMIIVDISDTFTAAIVFSASMLVQLFLLTLTVYKISYITTFFTTSRSVDVESEQRQVLERVTPMRERYAWTEDKGEKDNTIIRDKAEYEMKEWVVGEDSSVEKEVAINTDPKTKPFKTLSSMVNRFTGIATILMSPSDNTSSSPCDGAYTVLSAHDSDRVKDDMPCSSLHMFRSYSQPFSSNIHNAAAHTGSGEV